MLHLYWQLVLNPKFILCEVFRDIGSSQTKAYQPPKDFRRGALEEEMIYIFRGGAEVAGGRFQPVSLNQVVFGEDNIIFQEPHEDFDSVRNLSFPNM
jgi:hypothetical protein